LFLLALLPSGALARAESSGPLFLMVRSNVMTAKNVEPYLGNRHINPQNVAIFTVDYNPLTANHVRDYDRLKKFYRDLGPRADNGVVLMGYSATAKFAARLARDEGHVRGLFLMDPVDGAPPMCGAAKFPTFLTDDAPPISVPTTILSSEYGESKWLMNAACVPPGNGADHFAEHVDAGLLEMVRVERAGHLDFMNPPMAIVARMICHPGKRRARDVVLEAVGFWDRFLERILN
jgi:pimeloyl-ACP methyl ester carboxylesterase